MWLPELGMWKKIILSQHFWKQKILKFFMQMVQ